MTHPTEHPDTARQVAPRLEPRTSDATTPATAAPPATAPTRAFRGPVVGAAAIALAASLAIQIAVLPDAPSYGDPIEKVFAFHATHRGALAFVIGLEALNLPLLLGFLVGLDGLVARRRAGGTDWSRLAIAAGATLSAIYALYAVLWIGTVLSVGQLTGPTPLFQLAWQMHAAALALAMPALGTTFIGAASAAHVSGLTPLWQRVFGLVSGVLLIAAGGASLAIADGSPLLFVGVPGVLAWILWLLVTGVRLVRDRRADRPADASTDEQVLRTAS